MSINQEVMVFLIREQRPFITSYIPTVYVQHAFGRTNTLPVYVSSASETTAEPIMRSSYRLTTVGRTNATNIQRNFGTIRQSYVLTH